MRILGRDKIDSFSKKHPQSRKPLQAWFHEANSASWKRPSDIKDRYRSVDFLQGNRAIFNIKGHDYRLVVKVRYQGGILLIEWVGTHSQYDKETF